MKKTILITGATDGIGLATAKMLASTTAAKDTKLLLHGRNAQKLSGAKDVLSEMMGSSDHIETFVADMSQMSQVETLATEILKTNPHLDVLINNAGVYGPGSITKDGIDVRFAVNTIAPYLLTKRLLPSMNSSGRVVNVSSAALNKVNINGMVGKAPLNLSDFAAYAQSKLAMSMWSHHMSKTSDPVMIVAVNPGSFLGSKLARGAFGGRAGGDLNVGADILTRASLGEEFGRASGRFFDNDGGGFTTPHPDIVNGKKSEEVLGAMDEFLERVLDS